MTRTCNKCHTTKPIEQFCRYSGKGYSGYRHECKECARLYRNRWELTLTPEKAERYYAKKAVSDERQRQKLATERDRKFRERRSFLRGLIRSLHKEGLTNDVIADMAGLHVRTVRRIASESDSRTRFYGPTEEKILAVYADVKGIRP